MTRRPYGLFCPISLACEILEPRWTIQILAELWNGSTRFNDIRRGLGSISTALLARRLKEMEALGLVERIEDRVKVGVEYFRTEKAIRLEPVMDALAAWAQCNIEAEVALSGGDVSSLMWTVRRMIDLAVLPRRRAVLRFDFRDDPPPTSPQCWILVEPGAERPELCWRDPGREVDLFIETRVLTLAAIIEGRSSFDREKGRGGLFVSGDPGLARSMERWMRISSFADQPGVLPLP